MFKKLFGWLFFWRHQPQIPDQIDGFRKEEFPRPDPFDVRPEFKHLETPIATFSRVEPTGVPPRGFSPTGPTEPRRRSDDDDSSGLIEGAALGFLASELLSKANDNSNGSGGEPVTEWKGEGGQFSGGGASGSWDQADPIDNHLDAAPPDNSDVSDNSDSTSDSSNDDTGDSDESSGSDSNDSSDSSDDSSSDSSDSGSDSSSDSSSDSGGSDSSGD